MIAVLVDKMIRTQIVDCAAVANWIFSSELSRDFTRLFVWEILHSTIRKMNKHVLKIQKELEEAKEKLARQHKRRSDDDDRSSDRKDGALEEQIERLQEKVESAQSEQKNLFLVIFQRFIMILTEHLVRCETDGTTVLTPGSVRGSTWGAGDRIRVGVYNTHPTCFTIYHSSPKVEFEPNFYFSVENALFISGG